MSRVLHLIKDPANRTALEVVARHGGDPAISLCVVLLQAAAGLTERLPGEVYRLDGDGPSAYPTIDHGRLLDLIFEADTVVTW